MIAEQDTRAGGRYYGYPECCINYYIELTIHYVRCPECIRLDYRAVRTSITTEGPP